MGEWGGRERERGKLCMWEKRDEGMNEKQKGRANEESSKK